MPAIIYARLTFDASEFGAKADCPILTELVKKTKKDGKRSRKYWYRVNPSDPKDVLVATKETTLDQCMISKTIITKAEAESLRDEWAGKAPDGSAMSMVDYKDSDFYKNAVNP